MTNETTVTITIEGVRIERLDRIKTVVRSTLANFGRKYSVTSAEPKATKPSKGK